MTTASHPHEDPADGMPSRAALAKEVVYYRIEQFSRMLHGEQWAEDIEFDFWDLGHKPGATVHGKQAGESLAKYIRDLATLADGWWVWPDLVGQEGERPVFVSMAEWKKCLAERDA